MSLTLLILWCAMIVVGFVGSAVYSGLETGAYRLNRVRLQNLAHQGRTDAVLLRKLLASPTVLLSTLLIGNNLANYMGTAGLTFLLEARGLSEWRVVVFNILLVTPLLFVFGETLPKDLFGRYSDRLMYRLAPFLEGSRRLFTLVGLTPLIGLLTRSIFRVQGEKRGAAAFHPRRQVELLIREGVGHGLISQEQLAIFERALTLGERTVGDEMTRWRQVKTMRGGQKAGEVGRLSQQTDRARFPVVDPRGRLTGVVHVMDALLGDANATVEQLQRTALKIDAKTPLRDGLRRLQQSQSALAVITQNDQPVGVATIKDLVEPITGELLHW